MQTREPAGSTKFIYTLLPHSALVYLTTQACLHLYSDSITLKKKSASICGIQFVHMVTTKPQLYIKYNSMTLFISIQVINHTAYIAVNGLSSEKQYQNSKQDEYQVTRCRWDCKRIEIKTKHASRDNLRLPAKLIILF